MVSQSKMRQGEFDACLYVCVLDGWRDLLGRVQVTVFELEGQLVDL